MPPKKIAIIGATSTMAEHCARLWLAQQPTAELILVGRDLPRTQRVADDQRDPASAGFFVMGRFIGRGGDPHPGLDG